MIGALFLIFLFRAAFASNTFKEFIVDEECLNYTVYPLQYDVILRPYINEDRFYYDCEVSINVIANVPIRIIEMEAKHFDINSSLVRVYRGNQDIINSPRPYTHDRERGKLIIYLVEDLIPYSKKTQIYNIRMKFKKEITSGSDGVFLVKYVNELGQIRYMVQTRLSPNYVKYFIPCFDNPRFDTNFKFSVHVPPSIKNTYNTSLVISEKKIEEHNPILPPDAPLIINYVQSPQIYFYQVGFHFSDFSNMRVTSQYTNDTLVIWAPAYNLRNGRFILEFGESILELIRRYSMVNQSLTKGPINIVAVPKDLDGYEIGSWNLLTNNEIRIVRHPQFISAKQIEQMHFEFAQQLSRIWLGNPGEVKWTRWREEWFKEGVATYLAYYFLTQYNFGHKLDTKYKLPLHYYGMQMKQLAMDSDWLESTPALMSFGNEMAVNIPSRYKQLVTMKIASILWMIENYVGSDRFYPALRNYINNRRGMFVTLTTFKESLDRDTVECFIGHNGSRASVVLDSWLKHPGYPVVYVQVLRNRSPNVVQLKQWRFAFSGRRRESKYLIPISYVVQNTSNCYNCYQPWFTMNRHTYTFEENLNGGWIILNKNASGYYRVNYDEQTWKLIAKTLKEDLSSIDEMNRAQIVNDVFALFVSGDLNQNLAMWILDYLDQERSVIVWNAVASGFEMLKIDTARCGMTKYMYNEWQLFLRKKIGVIYKILITDIDQESQVRLFRSTITQLACSVGYQKCLSYTERLWNQWKTMNYRVDPDARLACYRTAYITRQSMLDENSFNTYEMDDRKNAMAIVQKENHFMYKIPVGEPRPENLTMTTTDTTPDLVSTERQRVPRAFGVKHPAGSLLILYSLLITALITFAFS